MVEQVPVGRMTYQLIDEAKTREEAFSQVEDLMAQARGTAHDVDDTVEVTVDALGKLLNVWLAPTAVAYGPDQLGARIVEVARVAMQEATQNSYNDVALLLGDDMTSLIESLSGMPAPARADDDDPGMTVDEFQRRREERINATRRCVRDRPRPAPDSEYDVDSFDPASLRSDR